MPSALVQLRSRWKIAVSSVPKISECQVSQSEISQCDVAAVTLAFEGGGSERDTVMLCNALAAKGLRVSIITLREEGALSALVDPAVRVVVTPFRRMRFAIPGIRRAIRSLAPAVVLSSGVPSLNLATLIAVRSLPRARRPKLVLREGAVPSMAARDPSRVNRIAYRILRRVYAYADRIVALTEGARRDLVQGFAVPPFKVAVAGTNAVLPRAMTDAVTDAITHWNSAQRKSDSGRENGLIVSVGRLSAEKDQYTLLRALTLLPPERPWRLAIIGDGPERAGLEAAAGRLGISERVLFTGQVADPLTWMRKANVAVCSSLYEGLGNAIVEALASGTPVVSTDCPYGPREILQGGRYGRLTPVGDPAAMAAAIEQALDRAPNRRFLMLRALDFTAERTAARFLEIFAELQPKPIRAPRRVATPRMRGAH